MYKLASVKCGGRTSRIARNSFNWDKASRKLHGPVVVLMKDGMWIDQWIDPKQPKESPK